MIFEFGDTNKLVYFMWEKYCITGNQCKNVAFCKAEKNKNTSLSSRQTRKLPNSTSTEKSTLLFGTWF